LEEGYRADAPYSGAMFDLITGQALELPEGKPIIKKTKTGKVVTSAGKVYSELLAAATDLLDLARGSKGRPNKDIRKFTDQIRTLIARWK
jgi:metallo-beta-lactamase family protein